MTNASTTSKIPTWFYIIAVVALIWNCMGVVAYLAEAFMSDEIFSSFTKEVQELYNKRPSWVTGAYAIAVFGGVLASMLLLLRKKLAKTVFLISLAGVIAQNVYTFVISDALNVLGTSSIYFPIVIVVIAVLLFLFSNYATKKGWLA
ncbi:MULTISPECIES: hypothetical protein [Cellulophaga]|uniref:Sugar transporter n=1 Tax=Cellulophaga geojensis KL-A TaxID=1328323 RepID=A0ABP3BCJ2_9FLAO|nr:MULTISPECIES: hypothetical protein [Cellulophaga]APU11662.1 hypothetical protein A5M85_15665 [Cellulophaga lytica]EWH14652.1 hypothetical protein KLA_02452 [Cellulophaga geojensis KL-A]MDO6852650.1 hypothetical protein [Cellulophaga lytica]TVZ09900.1 hypothetical protein JM80_2432 [Cellulophaga sp. RHA_52]SNQ45022.1 Conserved hypothetical membrane protein [Cellulophaga lytica]